MRWTSRIDPLWVTESGVLQEKSRLFGDQSKEDRQNGRNTSHAGFRKNHEIRSLGRIRL